MGVDLVRVELGERSYSIHVAPAGLDGLGAALRACFEPGRVVLVTNPVVAPLHAQAALDSLGQAGFEPLLLEIPDGEACKVLDTWSQLVHALLEARIDRRTPVIALGGGVTGDLVGFAAASVLRGVPFVQVPTTLLAMVDASVGGKTGFNTRHGKNLVGAFYQPRLVYAAVQVLTTLDEHEWRCGLGEALKHGVIRDAPFVDWIEENVPALREREPDATAQLVRRCCEIKAQVVADDEREAGERAILNFGHTVGHALETALGHGTLRHGEAVALGMIVETRFARERGWCQDPTLLHRIVRLSELLGLPTKLPPSTPNVAGDGFVDRLYRAVKMDKKSVRGRLNLIVPTALGTVRLQSATADDLAALMDLTASWETS
jgi:3-dehydroquinate synthase